MNSLKTNGSIHKTTDYDLFKWKSNNRPIDPTHVERIKFSFKRFFDFHLKPAIVTEDMEIIDGQHRIIAAKELGLPCFYTVDQNFSSEKMIQYNTTQKNWDINAYLNYWIVEGKEDYVKLKEFSKDLEFPLAITLSWVLQQGGSKYKTFRTGAFKFHLNEITLIAITHTKKLIRLMQDRNFKPKCIQTSRNFHAACKFIFENSLVNAEHFFDRFDRITFQFHQAVEWQEYLDQLIDIYNYDMRANRLKLVKDGAKRYITL